MAGARPAHRDARGTAAMECVSERISERLSRDNCSGMPSETHPAAAAPRTRNSRTHAGQKTRHANAR
eukprot:8704190-Lingulodinium_polyedra.AAC.1